MAAQARPWLKPGIFVGSLAPLGALAYRAATGALGANPISEALNRLGLTTLVFLVATLACTPAKLALGWTWPARLRRMLGLFAFFYGCLHFATYVAFDQNLHLEAILEDIAKRKFILVGFLALLLMLPAAVTSTDASVRRLGFSTWKRLHRWVYLAGILGVVHFVWRVKKDLTEPAVYGAVLALLLGLRIWDELRKAGKRGRTAPAAAP
jgi:sulfoxide reductase heme-binding subunit YedZ